MFSLEHHLRVFVFQVLAQEVQYLLIRHKPIAEWALGPVTGAVGLSEHMREAVVREVFEDTGIQRPHHVIEISHPNKELFGDIGLVEWNFAYQAGTPTHPIGTVTPGPKIGQVAWMNFEHAFANIERNRDRDTLVKLQLHIHGNQA